MAIQSRHKFYAYFSTSTFPWSSGDWSVHVLFIILLDKVAVWHLLQTIRSPLGLPSQFWAWFEGFTLNPPSGLRIVFDWVFMVFNIKHQLASDFLVVRWSAICTFIDPLGWQFASYGLLQCFMCFRQKSPAHCQVRQTWEFVLDFLCSISLRWYYWSPESCHLDSVIWACPEPFCSYHGIVACDV